MGLTQAILGAPTPRARSSVPDVPAGLDAIVYRAMSRNPADRYASAAELESDLKRLSAGITDVPTQSRPWPLLVARQPASVGLDCGRGRRGARCGSRRSPAAGRRLAGHAGGGCRLAARRSSRCCRWPARRAMRRTKSLAAGVADTLITTLSKVPGLTVVSRAATLKYQDRKMDTDAIAARAGRDDARGRNAAALRRPPADLAEPSATRGQGRPVAEHVRRHVCRGVRPAARGGRRRGGRARPARSERLRSATARRRTSKHSRTTRRRGRSSSARTSRRTSTGHRAVSERDQAGSSGSPARMPGLGEAYWRKYQATRDEKWSAQARDAINEALRLDPADPAVRLTLAAIYRGMGLMTDAADGAARRRSAARRVGDEAHRQLGRCSLSMGEPDAGDRGDAASDRPSPGLLGESREPGHGLLQPRAIRGGRRVLQADHRAPAG